MMHLLLKIPPIFLVDEDEIKIIPCTEFLIHVSECWRQVKSAKE